VASALTFILPVALSVLVFLATWLNETRSGAGLSEDNRPIAMFMLAAFGAGGWLMGTSALYAIHRPPNRLPRTARLFALQVLWGWPSDEHGSRPARAVAGVRQLVGLAVVVLPVLTFTPPMLLGWLVQTGVWRPEEAAAVGAMGLVVVAWSLFLIARARQSE